MAFTTDVELIIGSVVVAFTTDVELIIGSVVVAFTTDVELIIGSVVVAFTTDVELIIGSADVSIIDLSLESVELSKTIGVESGSIVTLTPLFEFEFKLLVRSSSIIPENENSSAYAEP